MGPKIHGTRGKNLREGDLNARLLAEGGPVFRKLRGFSNAVWMRRLGIQNGEMDFFLLNANPPRMAVVECCTKVAGDLDQLKKYFRFVRNVSTYDLVECISRSLHSKNRKEVGQTRSKANRDAPLRKWMENRSGLRGLIERGRKHPVVAFLIVYIVLNPRGSFQFLNEIKIATSRYRWAQPFEDMRLVFLAVV